MIVNCGNVSTLPYADKLKLVAGKNGIDRVIKWVHYMENPEYIDWLKGGELILTTGLIIKDDLDILVRLVNDLNHKNVSGLVINIGPYIDKTPKKVIDIANSFGFPIFELPFKVRLIDISQSICKAIFMSRIEQESMNSFMKKIIYGDVDFDSQEIINRAVLYGYNPQSIYCTFVIMINNFTDFIINNGTWDEEIAFRFIQQINQIIVDVMSVYDKNTIRIVENNSIIVMLSVDNIERDKIDLIANEMINRIRYKVKGINVDIGISNLWSRLKNFRYSVNNAQKALKILNVIKDGESVLDYNNIGIYKLLFQIEKKSELKIFYNEILGKLIDYDTKNSTKLVETLKVYIDENCNLIKTSNSLFIHKNTLKYRIKRIEEISGSNLRNMDDLFNFSMAFKIKNFITCI
ncbi:PucR family transcriptional regulator [Clostridium sp. LBM24168]